MTSPQPMASRRRAILAGGLPLVLAIIGLGVHSWALQAVSLLADQSAVGYSVGLSVPASDGQVRMTIDNADVTLRARPGSGSRIRVRASLRGALARPTFSHRSTAAGLVLNSRCRVPEGICSLRFAITAPAGLPVTASDAFGNLTASGLRGTVTLSDGSGDLDASRLAGDIRLADSFGNLTAAGLSGTIRLASNSGDITAAGLTGDTRLTASFGNIKVTGLSAADVICSNQSGDITLTFTRVPRRVTVTDSFGNITLRLPSGSAAYHVSTHTSFGNVTVAVRQASSAPNVITATDNSGDITIG